MKAAAYAALLACAISHATASAAQGPTMVYMGVSTCGELLSASQDTRLAGYGWLSGALSALNMVVVPGQKQPVVDALKDVSLGTLQGAIDAYCGSHPLDDLDRAAVHIFSDLRSKAERDR